MNDVNFFSQLNKNTFLDFLMVPRDNTSFVVSVTKLITW